MCNRIYWLLVHAFVSEYMRNAAGDGDDDCKVGDDDAHRQSKQANLNRQQNGRYRDSFKSGPPDCLDSPSAPCATIVPIPPGGEKGPKR